MPLILVLKSRALRTPEDRRCTSCGGLIPAGVKYWRRQTTRNRKALKNEGVPYLECAVMPNGYVSVIYSYCFEHKPRFVEGGFLSDSGVVASAMGSFAEAPPSLRTVMRGHNQTLTDTVAVVVDLIKKTKGTGRGYEIYDWCCVLAEKLKEFHKELLEEVAARELEEKHTAVEAADRISLAAIRLQRFITRLDGKLVASVSVPTPQWEEDVNLLEHLPTERYGNKRKYKNKRMGLGPRRQHALLGPVNQRDRSAGEFRRMRVEPDWLEEKALSFLTDLPAL